MSRTGDPVVGNSLDPQKYSKLKDCILGFSLARFGGCSYFSRVEVSFFGNTKYETLALSGV